MTTIDSNHFIRAMLLLDASIEALEAAGQRERKREAGKSLRCITEQQRAETVREFVRKMDAEYQLGLDD